MKNKMNRRQFLISLGSIGVVGRRVFAEVKALGYPEYWAAQVARAAERVNANAAKCPFGFWFLTDPHTPANRLHSGELLAALGRATPLRRVLCGGDIPEAFGERHPTDKGCVDTSIALYRDKIVSPCEAAGMDFFPAKGNHDFTVRHSPTSKEGFTYSEKDAREILLKIRSADKIVTNENDPTACYYYIDDPKSRFRVIVADTTDHSATNRTYWAVMYGIGPVQLKWLAENAVATIPDGWNAVVMHHVPLSQVAGSADDEKLYAPFRRLLEAYNARGKWTEQGASLDFARASGKIVLDIAGHHHAELQTYNNGLLYMSEPCDAAYGDYIARSKPWCEELPKKTTGTPFEQTFDAIQIDLKNRVIHATRIGGGADRVIHLDPLALKVGDTPTISPAFLKNVNFFGAYDGDRCTLRKHPTAKYQYLTDYFNNHLTVDAAGKIRALSSGCGIVLARNATGEKEIWPVRIA